MNLIHTFFVFVIFYEILCKGAVYSKGCKCECKPKNQLFTCDCKAACYQNSSAEEMAYILTVSEQKFAIPRDGNVKVNEIEFIQITDVNITQLNSIEFEVKLKNLTHLTFKNCGIQQIDSIAFNDTRLLTHLNIDDNLITTLQEDTFIFVKKLQYLNLKNNSIAYLPEILFKKLPQLIGLDLSYNNIKYVPENLFGSLNNLTYIHLDNNLIEKIPPNLFANNQRLGKIYLNNNNIQNVSEKLFTGLTNLYEVYLERNQIKILPDLFINNLFKLQLVNLNHNKIRVINSKSFINNSKLKAVFLNNNHIKYIHPNIITTSPKLKYLNLNNNEIICDCKMKQFFIASKNANLTLNIECSRPKKLMNQNFTLLTAHDFVCPPKIFNCTVTVKKPENYTKVCCEIIGDPAPKFAWIFEEKEMKNNQDYNVKYGRRNEELFWAHLTIFNISSKTKGNYTLNVTSIGGSDQYIFEALLEDEESSISATAVIIIIFSPIVLLIIIIIVLYLKRRNIRETKQDTVDTIEMAPIIRLEEKEDMYDEFDSSIIETVISKNNIKDDLENTKTSSQNDCENQENLLTENDKNMTNHLSIEENNNNLISVIYPTTESHLTTENSATLNNDNYYSQEPQIEPEEKETDIRTTNEMICATTPVNSNSTQHSIPSSNSYEQEFEYSDSEPENNLEPIEEVEETSDENDEENGEIIYLPLTTITNIPQRTRTTSDSWVLDAQANMGYLAANGIRTHTTSECSAEYYADEYRYNNTNYEVSTESMDYSINSSSSYVAYGVQQSARRTSNVSRVSSSSVEVFNSRQTNSRIQDEEHNQLYLTQFPNDF